MLTACDLSLVCLVVQAVNDSLTLLQALADISNTRSPKVGKPSAQGRGRPDSDETSGNISIEEDETIMETIESLRALGFSDEDVRWAVEEAKSKLEAKRSDITCRGTSRVDDLPRIEEAISRLSLSSHAEQTTPSRSTLRAASDTSEPLIDRVLPLVLPGLNTWDIAFLTFNVSTKWRKVSDECLRVFQSSEDEEDEDTAPSQLKRIDPPCFAAKFPWARFLAQGGFKQVFLVYNEEKARKEAVRCASELCYSTRK